MTWAFIISHSWRPKRWWRAGRELEAERGNLWMSWVCRERVGPAIREKQEMIRLLSS